MKALKFSQLTSRLTHWRQYDREKFAVNAERSWFLLCLFFLSGLLMLSGGLVYLNYKINSAESTDAKQGQTVVELDEKRLGLILKDHTRRQTDYQKLNEEKPTIIDPGM